MDERRSAPHVGRNSGPIIDVLTGILPDEGLVLEVASGSGEHAIAFAAAFPHLLWQPTDADPAGVRSIAAWRDLEAPGNLLAPIHLDAASADWPVARADAIVCINMVHISPWQATVGLLERSGRLLAPGDPLYLYGAYRQGDVATAPSNEAFDQSLKARNPDWGLRHVEDVIEEAGRHSLELEAIVPMPANNLSVIFRRC